MKINKIEEKLIETRNYKIINYDKINENIINNELYERLLQEDDTDYISENLIRIINDEMEKQAPMKKIKNQRKGKGKIFSSDY